MKLITLRIEPEIIKDLDSKVAELKKRTLIKSSVTRSSVIRELIVTWIKVQEKRLAEVTEVEKLMEGLKNE